MTESIPGQYVWPEMNVEKLRPWCLTHEVVLKMTGSDRIFTPTYGIVDEEKVGSLEIRQDKEGWLSLDTSEFKCPADEECDQDWCIQAK